MIIVRIGLDDNGKFDDCSHFERPRGGRRSGRQKVVRSRKCWQWRRGKSNPIIIIIMIISNYRVLFVSFWSCQGDPRSLLFAGRIGGSGNVRGRRRSVIVWLRNSSSSGGGGRIYTSSCRCCWCHSRWNNDRANGIVTIEESLL